MSIRRRIKRFEVTKIKLRPKLFRGKSLCSDFVEFKFKFSEIECGNLKGEWLVLLGNSTRIIKRKEVGGWN